MADLPLFLGRFHPLLVHLPIGILIGAALLEVAGRWSGRTALRAAAGPVLIAGAFTALLSACAGYLLGHTGGYGGATFVRHQWLGIGVAFASVLTALLHYAQGTPPARAGGRLYAAALACTVALLLAAGHAGAALTHGDTYLTEHAPQLLRSLFSWSREPTKAQAAAPEQTQVYAGIVQPILTANCVACHGPDKAEGKLRLDTIDGIRKGGEGGAAIVAGRGASSEMIRRIWLPGTHKDAMPPSGRRPLSPADATLLRWWIDRGAPVGKTVADLELGADVQPILEALLGPMSIGGPTLPRAAAPAADSRAIAAAEATGASVVPLSDRTTFLRVHCTNAGASFDDSKMPALAGLAPQITWLDLSGTAITDRALTTVARLTNLTRLHLDRTGVTDDGLAQLRSLAQLEYLNLYGTKVTDAGLSHLAALANLRSLYVWRTKVTPEGIAHLQSQAPRLVVNDGFKEPAAENAAAK
jgi:mono/diheme cytochrome c family protein